MADAQVGERSSDRLPVVDVPPDPDRELAAARVDEAASRRRRDRREVELLRLEATFTGSLMDFAKRGSFVVCVLRSGRRVSGSIVTVGDDVVIIDTGARRAAVRLGDVVVVEPPPGATAASGSAQPTELRLIDVAVGLVGTDDQVELVVGDARVTGTIEACGVDVLSIRPSSAPDGACYVALDSVSELWLSSAS